MACAKKTKPEFNYDEQGRAILGSAKEMAAWVELGFEEQDKRKITEFPFYQHYIDLSNCVLYISYPIDSNETKSQIFNLCDMAGVVPGIEKIEDDSNYLYEVKLDIHFDASVLYGNFFHYVKFDGMVRMNKTIVNNTFSCFKCLFLDYVYMQDIHIMGSSDFEQCNFRKGVVLTCGKADLFHFNNCAINERMWLSSLSLDNKNHDNYHQSIELTNSSAENFKLSKVNTNGLPIYIGYSKIKGMHIDNISLDGSLCFYSCSMEGVVTAVIDEDGQRNKIKELVFHSCDIDAQYHMENTDIEKFELNFSRIDDKGRFRLSKCDVKELTVGCSSVYGQMDVLENTISTICLEGTCVHGYLLFQDNEVKVYIDRQTLRLLKNEAIKVNDKVAAMRLYANEMQLMLSDKSIPVADKVALWLNKVFSNFGESWVKALCVTLLLSVVFTLLMLGFGSGNYKFDPTLRFMGIGAFVTSLLDSINVFSIPLFSETIAKYNLNVFGQILYFLIKLVVAYGSYQFIVAFRKYGRS